MIHTSRGQKRPLDTLILDHWPTISPIRSITNDGKYVLYHIDNYPFNHRTTIFQAVDGAWKKEILDADILAAAFSDDSKYGLFIKDNTLHVLQPGLSIERTIPNVSAYTKCNINNTPWLLCNRTQGDKLCVTNLRNGDSMFFENVQHYVVDEKDGKLILAIKSDDNESKGSVLIADLKHQTVKTIWKGAPIEKLIQGPLRNQIAFTCLSTGNLSSNKNFLWYYQKGYDSAVCVQLADTLSVQNTDITNFDISGDLIFLDLKKKEIAYSSPYGVARLNIWSYTDPKLQSQQLIDLQNQHVYKGYLSIQSKQLHVAAQPDEQIKYNRYQVMSDRYLLTSKKNSDIGSGEGFWNALGYCSYNLISTEDHTSKTILKNTNADASLSSYGKYVVYYDENNKSYYSYCIRTGVTHNITDGVLTEWEFYNSGHWSTDDKSLVLYDANDVWELDPGGIRRPRSITAEYGREHNLTFRLSEYKPGELVDLNKPILLTAFNNITKENGFYLVDPRKNDTPAKLIMGPNIYFAPGNSDSMGEAPLKAANSETYLLKIAGAKESPNLYITKDFKRYKRLSSIYPEREYNWMYSELHEWRTRNGRKCQGILYKPDNFDATKMYPVIFNCYEKKSHLLNEYLVPQTSTGNMNIPWFVSNGYLVFTPDIYVEKGRIVESVLDVLNPAVEYLTHKPFIDSTRIGIQGFSFGAYITNLSVTNTNKFAAAFAGAGVTNMIAAYSRLDAMGTNRQEVNQQDLGTVPSVNPALYMESSPIFKANRVNTPLLMMHNRNDEAVDFTQGLDFFLALRRLGKRVWLLEYEGEAQGHGVSGRNAVDFTVRLTQFFDHYLQSKAPPKWMIYGTPANLKGKDPGYEFDSIYRSPRINPLSSPATTDSNERNASVTGVPLTPIR
jgi:dipeptidyl aminopeptidase/acylaminoacyl peptidase